MILLFPSDPGINNRTFCESSKYPFHWSVDVVQSLPFYSVGKSFFEKSMVFEWGFLTHPNWNNRCWTVDRERGSRIMHDTPIIVPHPKIRYLIRSIFIEIMFFSRLNIFPKNFHIVITIRCWLSMIETQCMYHLMDNCEFFETTCSHFTWLQIETLFSTYPADWRRTSRPVAFYMDEIFLGGSWDEF